MIDLAISMQHAGSFAVDAQSTFTIGVENVGTAATIGTTRVTDTLPAWPHARLGVRDRLDLLDRRPDRHLHPPRRPGRRGAGADADDPRDADGGDRQPGDHQHGHGLHQRRRRRRQQQRKRRRDRRPSAGRDPASGRDHHPAPPGTWGRARPRRGRRARRARRRRAARRRRRRSDVRRGISLLAGLAALAAAAPADAADYVGLGDSYSSGTGTASEYSDNCQRTTAAYPTLIDPSIPGTGINLSCSGGRTQHIDQEAQAPGNTVAQLDVPGAVNADTDVVTLQIGGNDAGFVDTLIECGNPFGDCDAAIEEAEQTATTELPPKLNARLRRGPGAGAERHDRRRRLPADLQAEPELQHVLQRRRGQRPERRGRPAERVDRGSRPGQGPRLRRPPARVHRPRRLRLGRVDQRPLLQPDGELLPPEGARALERLRAAGALLDPGDPRHDDQRQAPGPLEHRQPHLPVHLRAGRRLIPVQARRRRLRRLHLAAPVHGPRRGLAHDPVRGINAAGNVDQFPATYAWTIDVTAPGRSDRPGQRPDRHGARPTPRASRSRRPTGPPSCQCRLDGAAFAAAPRQRRYTDLADGAAHLHGPRDRRGGQRLPRPRAHGPSTRPRRRRPSTRGPPDPTASTDATLDVHRR